MVEMIRDIDFLPLRAFAFGLLAVLLVTMFSPAWVTAQSAKCISVASGGWANSGTWEEDNDFNDVPDGTPCSSNLGAYPGEDTNVEIAFGHTVVLGSAITGSDAIASLTIANADSDAGDPQTTLIMEADLEVDGDVINNASGGGSGLRQRGNLGA
jgi:hypothetical protein